jgi:hypothetical protein
MAMPNCIYTMLSWTGILRRGDGQATIQESSCRDDRLKAPNFKDLRLSIRLEAPINATNSKFFLKKATFIVILR